jgi:hypothetical protein
MVQQQQLRYPYLVHSDSNCSRSRDRKTNNHSFKRGNIVESYECHEIIYKRNHKLRENIVGKVARMILFCKLSSVSGVCVSNTCSSDAMKRVVLAKKRGKQLTCILRSTYTDARCEIMSVSMYKSSAAALFLNLCAEYVSIEKERMKLFECS